MNDVYEPVMKPCQLSITSVSLRAMLLMKFTRNIIVLGTMGLSGFQDEIINRIKTVVSS